MALQEKLGTTPKTSSEADGMVAAKGKASQVKKPAAAPAKKTPAKKAAAPKATPKKAPAKKKK
jgi:hypothetical protein